MQTDVCWTLVQRASGPNGERSWFTAGPSRVAFECVHSMRCEGQCVEARRLYAEQRGGYFVFLCSVPSSLGVFDARVAKLSGCVATLTVSEFLKGLRGGAACLSWSTCRLSVFSGFSDGAVACDRCRVGLPDCSCCSCAFQCRWKWIQSSLGASTWVAFSGWSAGALAEGLSCGAALCGRVRTSVLAWRVNALSAVFTPEWLDGMVLCYRR